MNEYMPTNEELKQNIIDRYIELLRIADDEKGENKTLEIMLNNYRVKLQQMGVNTDQIK